MDALAAELLVALESFVTSTDRLAVLYESFYNPYFDKADTSQIVEPTLNFFDEVAERIDFTDDKPDPASRRHGYRSTTELRAWLRDRLPDFLPAQGV